MAGGARGECRAVAAEAATATAPAAPAAGAIKWQAALRSEYTGARQADSRSA